MLFMNSLETVKILMIAFCAGGNRFEKHLKLRMLEVRALRIAGRIGPPAPIDQKEFKPVNSLPKLVSYEGVLSDEYWNKWVKLTFDKVGEYPSWVDGSKLRDRCESAGIPNRRWVESVVRDVVEGSNIGCKQEGRLPTRANNDASAALYGERVADSLQSWVKEGIAVGPLMEEELPWTDFTVSPITVRLKPDGKARVILDLSAPHNDVELGQGLPVSVNKGICKSDYKTVMTSTREWINCLQWAGSGCMMSKSDLQSAYKHFKVRREDLKLQVVYFGGRYFCELKLVFGATSSPALYNYPALLFTESSRRLSGLNPRFCVQQLDDVLTAVPKQEAVVGEAFNESYRGGAEELGIRLASEADPDKAFTLKTEGVCLGVKYNTTRWCWNLPTIKVKLMLSHLHVLLTEDEITNEVMLKLNGRLNHYGPLIRQGKWWRTPLLRLQKSDGKKSLRFRVTEEARVCAKFWVSFLNRLRVNDLPIPDIRDGFPASAHEVYSDAAGSSGLYGSGHGMGLGLHLGYGPNIFDQAGMDGHTGLEVS